MKKIKPIFFAICFAGLLFSCEYATIKPDPVEELDPTVDILFATEIYPFFESKSCGGCHPSAKGYDFSSVAGTYTAFTTQNIVDESNVANSLLFNSLKSGGYHESFGISESDIKSLTAKVALWIEQGKKNN